LIVMCVLSQAAYDEDNKTVNLPDNDFVDNFKTYNYITSDDTIYGAKYRPIKKENVVNNKNLIEFTFCKSTAYLDISLSHPTLQNEIAIRKFMFNKTKCCVVKMGGSARLKKQILSRKDSQGNTWKAHSSIKFN
jgi:hypothetical protein